MVPIWRSCHLIITSWQIEKVEAVTDFIFLGSKITVNGDCSREIKTRLFLGRKALTNLDSMLKKQRHHFADKDLYSSKVFSGRHVWMWELDHKEGWVPKNWCLWIVVLENTLESPLDSKRSNQSILKEISPEYSLEGLMLKLQHFGHVMWRADSLEKNLMLGKTEGKRRGWQWMRWLDDTADSVNVNLSNLREIVKDREA